MTFSFYYSLKALPDDFKFVGKLARFTPWQKFTQIELPFATKGLVYNSMVSLAGGWFFLSIIEAFTIGDQDYRVKGVGSYMSVAQEQNDNWAQFYAVIAVMHHGRRDRPADLAAAAGLVEQIQDRGHGGRISGPLRRPASIFSRSRVVNWIHAHQQLTRRFDQAEPRPDVVDYSGRKAGRTQARRSRRKTLNAIIPWRKILFVIGIAGYGGYSLKVPGCSGPSPFAEWLIIVWSLFLTLIRVLCRDCAQHADRRSDRRLDRVQSQAPRYLMPLTQIAASFPIAAGVSRILFC